MKLSLAKAVIVTGKKVELNDPSNKCLQQLEHISISNLLFVRFLPSFPLPFTLASLSLATAGAFAK